MFYVSINGPSCLNNWSGGINFVVATLLRVIKESLLKIYWYEQENKSHWRPRYKKDNVSQWRPIYKKDNVSQWRPRYKQENETQWNWHC